LFAQRRYGPLTTPVTLAEDNLLAWLDERFQRSARARVTVCDHAKVTRQRAQEPAKRSQVSAACVSKAAEIEEGRHNSVRGARVRALALDPVRAAFPLGLPATRTCTNASLRDCTLITVLVDAAAAMMAARALNEGGGCVRDGKRGGLGLPPLLGSTRLPCSGKEPRRVDECYLSSAREALGASEARRRTDNLHRIVAEASLLQLMKVAGNVADAEPAVPRRERGWVAM